MVTPIKTTDFGLATHTYRQFNAIVPQGTDPKELENPALWTHIAPQLTEGSEVRVVSEDYSFVAYMICTFSAGSAVRMKTMHGYELETVDYDALQQQTGDVVIKLRGPKKWCLVRQSTGDVIREGIPTQSEAMKELEQYNRALAS
jgi:hypothetical protein